MTNPESSPEAHKPEEKIIFFPSEREARLKRLTSRVTTYLKGFKYTPDRSNPAYWLDQLNPKKFKLNAGHQMQIDKGIELNLNPYLAEVKANLGSLISELRVQREKKLIIQWDEVIVDKLISLAKAVIDKNVSTEEQIQRGWIRSDQEIYGGEEKEGIQRLKDESIESYQEELKRLLVHKD